MSRLIYRNFALLLGVFLAVWLGFRFLLPLGLPFLLGGLLAFVAEPAVGLLARKLPRTAAAGIGVLVTLVLIGSLFFLLMALLVRELGTLAGALPNLEETAIQGLSSLEGFLLKLADRAPDGVRTLLSQTVTGLFSDGTAVMDRVTQWIPGVATKFLGHIPGSAISIGTGILSGFMISARLPAIKTAISRRMPPAWQEKYLPALRRMRTALGGWLKAQLKLMAVTYGIVTVGLLLTGISYSPFWALLVAAVDAVPVLGTGTVLIPWILVSLLQNQPFRALGLLCTYLAAALTRTVLEPRLVGRHLGLDPLVTLVFFYVGYKFWGVLGMLFAPLLATAAKSLTEKAG